MISHVCLSCFRPEQTKTLQDNFSERLKRSKPLRTPKHIPNTPGLLIDGFSPSFSWLRCSKAVMEQNKLKKFTPQICKTCCISIFIQIMEVSPVSYHSHWHRTILKPEKKARAKPSNKEEEKPDDSGVESPEIKAPGKPKAKAKAATRSKKSK